MSPPPDEIAAGGGVRLRRMRDEPAEHARAAAWLNAPHVRRWWDADKPARTPEDVAEELAPDLRAGSPATLCVIEWSGRPVGFLQFYPWAAYPDEVAAVGLETGPDDWGLDVYIGEPDMLGRGVGATAVDLACRHLLDDRGASAVLLVTARDNLRAQRAYEKVGFVRVAEVLDTDTRDGERIPSFAMARRAGAPGGGRRGDGD